MSNKNTDIEDLLSWKKFQEDSNKRMRQIPKKVELFNRLVLESENFFSIVGVGPFTQGYLLVITKKLIPSFSHVEKKNQEELKWFIKINEKILEKTYKNKIVKFEHGLCSCVGGLDRAHLHIMTIGEKSSSNSLKKSIKKTLNERKAGIKHIIFKNTKLENIHDITTIMENSDKNSYKVVGKILTLNKLKDIDEKIWPQSSKSYALSGGNYVYFEGPYREISFLTKKNFNTQLGRHIVYNNEILVNDSFKNKCEKILNENPYSQIWRWQEFNFNKNILKNMYDLSKTLKNRSFDKNELKFKFKTHL